MTAVETEDGHDHPPEGRGRAEHPAQGGPAPRPGAGRLLRRRQAARDGIRPLRPLAVRPRAARVDRRQRGARAARRVRHADRRRGRDPHRPLLPDRCRAGWEREGLRARGREGALRRGAGRRGGRGDARARARRVGARGGRVRAARRRRRRTRSGRRRRPGAPRGVRRERLVQRCLGVGRRRRRVRRGGPRREDLGAPLRALQLDAPRARRRARRVQPRYRAVDDHDEQPVPGLRRDHDGAGHARRHRQAAHGHAGHRWRVRQQDHLAPAARRALPARAEAQPARAVDRVADGLPPVDVPRQRALVPRHRGRRDGRRDDDRLPVDGPRRRRGVPPLRAARRGDLVAGRARDVRLAEPPTRLHAGDDEQGAVLAEPRLLADAAPLVHRADHRHRGPRARLRPRRAAQEELRAARADALRDAERLRLRLGRLPEGARRSCST